MFNVVKTLRFEAAHKIPGHQGACKNLHGHTYTVEVELESSKLYSNGFVVDFAEIKRAADLILPDHRYLNEHYPGFVPSAENLARQFYLEFQEFFPDHLKSITVHEGPNNSAKYWEA